MYPQRSITKSPVQSAGHLRHAHQMKTDAFIPAEIVHVFTWFYLRMLQVSALKS